MSERPDRFFFLGGGGEGLQESRYLKNFMSSQELKSHVSLRAGILSNYFENFSEFFSMGHQKMAKIENLPKYHKRWLKIPIFSIFQFLDLYGHDIQMRALKTAAYYISPIEIGLIWAKIAYLQSHSKALGFNLQKDMK